MNAPHRYLVVPLFASVNLLAAPAVFVITGHDSITKRCAVTKKGDVYEVTWRANLKPRSLGEETQTTFIVGRADLEEMLRHVTGSHDFELRKSPLGTPAREPGFVVTIRATVGGKERLSYYTFPPGDLPGDLRGLLGLLRFEEVKEPMP